MWNLLGLAHSFNKNFDEAERAFRKASELAPDVALYWTNLSSLLRVKGRLSENSHLTTLARECSHKAIDLQPQNARLYVDVALTYLDESDFSAARQWLDRGLSCEAKTAMDELEALLVLAELHVKAKDYEKVKDVAEQVKNIPEATIPVIAYASKRLTSLGFEMFKANDYFSALAMVEAAQFLYYKKERVGLEVELRSAVDCLNEFSALETDSQVIEPVKRLASMMVSRLLDEDEIPYSAFIDVYLSLKDYQGSAVVSSFERLKSAYPNIVSISPETIDEAREKGVMLMELDELEKDDSVVQPVKDLCRYICHNALGGGRDGTVIGMIGTAIDNTPTKLLRASVTSVRKKYPKIYSSQKQLFDELVRASRRW